MTTSNGNRERMNRSTPKSPSSHRIKEAEEILDSLKVLTWGGEQKSLLSFLKWDTHANNALEFLQLNVLPSFLNSWIVHFHSDMISIWSVVIMCNTGIHSTVIFVTFAYRRLQHTNSHKSVSEVADAPTQLFDTAALWNVALSSW